ncbi:hypothetical protein C5614_20395 [Massilia phosphatilytica]|nr:hypothetical protein C5614_20395 [Massilia phosphatilytica]
MLDSTVLRDFMDNFFGYGNLAAPVWFIGMEEGGGASEKEISDRLKTWHGDGPENRTVKDLAEFHLAFGDATRFTEEKVAIQSTWSKLMRTLLVAQGETPTTERLRQYQKEKLGRSGGDAALLELLPLPRPSMKDWDYDTWSGLPELETFATYQSSVRPQRIAAIKALIAKCKPRAVIFYGTGYTVHWEAIAGMSFPKGHYPRVAGTAPLYMLLPHPVAHGKINQYYEAAGKILFDSGIFRIE